MKILPNGLSYRGEAERRLSTHGGQITIAELLKAKEGENVEFKEAKNSFEFDTLVKYACAVSNHGGGRVVFGITGKRPRKVVGSQTFDNVHRAGIETLFVDSFNFGSFLFVV